MTIQETAPVINLHVKEVNPFSALCFTTRTTLPALSEHHSTVASDLYSEATRLNLDITGPIQWVYTGVSGDVTNEFRLDIVLPIRQPESQPNGFSYQVLGAFRCASYSYKGAWSELSTIYAVLFPQFYQCGYQNDGRIREIYTTIDLQNPANCVTEIQLAII